MIPGRAAPLPVGTKANKRRGYADAYSKDKPDGWRKREKDALGDGIRHLRTVESWHLWAFVRWHLLGGTLEDAANAWAEAQQEELKLSVRPNPPARQSVWERVRELQRRYDLPKRAVAHQPD